MSGCEIVYGRAGTPSETATFSAGGSCSIVGRCETPYWTSGRHRGGKGGLQKAEVAEERESNLQWLLLCRYINLLTEDE